MWVDQSSCIGGGAFRGVQVLFRRLVMLVGQFSLLRYLSFYLL